MHLQDQCERKAVIPVLAFLVGGASSSSEDDSSLLDFAVAAGLAGGVFTGTAAFTAVCDRVREISQAQIKTKCI